MLGTRGPPFALGTAGIPGRRKSYLAGQTHLLGLSRRGRHGNELLDGWVDCGAIGQNDEGTHGEVTTLMIILGIYRGYR